MSWRLAADAVLILHLGFILFVVLGGLLALRWRWMPWLHLPAVTWAVLLEFCGWICPLTPLENALRQEAGQAGYPGGFIEHYLLPVIYPAGLTRDMQWLLGSLALAINGIVYGVVFWRRRRSAAGS